MTSYDLVGLLLTVFLSGVAGVAVIFVYRHGGGAALGELERANGILTRRVRELEELNGALAARVADLERKTDVSLAMQPLSELLTVHEKNAERRTGQLLDVLHMIAERMGPDADGMRAVGAA